VLDNSREGLDDFSRAGACFSGKLGGIDLPDCGCSTRKSLTPLRLVDCANDGYNAPVNLANAVLPPAAIHLLIGDSHADDLCWS
jgi:hypothetical protein